MNIQVCSSSFDSFMSVPKLISALINSASPQLRILNNEDLDGNGTEASVILFPTPCSGRLA
jgi:hypothetical protein